MSLQVVLVSPQIPWNTGNVGRTCLAVGAGLHLVEPLGFSLESREVRRAGLDYWPRVAPRVWPDWRHFEAAARQMGPLHLFSAEGERELWEVEFDERAVLGFGSEVTGLPPEVRHRFGDRLIRIPQIDGGVRSLNLSTAVGVALFEALRQCRPVELRGRRPRGTS